VAVCGGWRQSFGAQVIMTLLHRLLSDGLERYRAKPILEAKPLERLQSDLKLLAAEKSSTTEAEEKIFSGFLIPTRQTRRDIIARALPGTAPAPSNALSCLVHPVR
jgi:hypothetical protein